MKPRDLFLDAYAVLVQAGAAVTCDQKDRATARLRARLNGYQLIILLEGERHPRVTILGPRGYVCSNATASSVELAAHWLIACLEVNRVAQIANKQTQRRRAALHDPWTGQLKHVRKALICCGHQPRTPECSEEHTNERFWFRFRRRLSSADRAALLEACAAQPPLEVQVDGRALYRLAHAGLDLIVVTGPGASHLVTALRLFDYVALRGARHLIDRPAREWKGPALNTDVPRADLSWVRPVTPARYLCA